MFNLKAIEVQENTLSATIKDNLMPNSENLSIRGLSKLCDVDKTSIIYRGKFNSEKLARKMRQQGFQAEDVIKNGFNPVATWLVIEYFAFESKAKALGAKQIAKTVGSFGIYQAFNSLSESLLEKCESESLYKRVNEFNLLATQIDAASKLGNIENPQLKSALEKHLLQLVSVEEKEIKEVKEVKAVENRFNARSARDRTKELGFTDEQIGNGIALGKYISKRVKPIGKKLNGRYTVNVYEVTEELDTVITEFFKSQSNQGDRQKGEPRYIYYQAV